MNYIVQPGDSLYKIARQFNTSVEALAAINSIAEPRLIHPGKILEIPDNITKTDEGDTYIVQPGESLYDIAKQHGASLRELISYNRIPVPYTAYPGQILHIPMSEQGLNAEDNDACLPPDTPIAAEKPPAFDKAPKERPGTPEENVIHIVQPGETLYSIAKKYNVSAEKVIRLNNIMRPDLVYPGLLMEIPAEGYPKDT